MFRSKLLAIPTLLSVMLVDCLSLPAAADTTDHTLEIDGYTYDLKLGTASKVRLKDGREVTILLKRKEFALFSVDGASFEYPSSISVNSSPPDDGMTQHIGVTALGTLFLVQVHDQVDLPALLTSVYDKMVEEPKAMGLAIDRSEISRSLANGIVLKGLSAHYKTTDDDVTIDIFTHAGASKSYLVLSMHDNQSSPEEKQIIDRFWKTLDLR